MKPTFTFWTDPGHGWLEVNGDDIHAAGLKPLDFSHCSYRSGNRFFLEEDCDAPKFIKAYREKNGEPIYYVPDGDGNDSFIRSLPSIY
jgi:hypothetical protein